MDCFGSVQDEQQLIPVFSLYAGVGGLDLGAAIAGFDVAAALDADASAVAIHERVFKSRTFCFRTEGLDVKNVIKQSGLPRDGSSVLIGGPPCTAFSHAGFWIERKREGRDVQSHRIRDYLRFVAELRPRAFVMENVPGLLFRNHRAVLNRFESSCSGLGYSVSHAILNAADYGVPQSRRRLFVVGVKGRVGFQFSPGAFFDRPRSSGWAIKKLSAKNNPPEADEVLRGKYASLLPKVPPGQNYLFYTKERGCANPLFGWRKKYWSFLLKLDPQLPAPTIPATRITNNGPFHWANRHLRLLELRRLQTFPDEFPVDVGSKGRTQLGNAVPPLLAAQVMWQVKRLLEDRRRAYPDRLRVALDPTSDALKVSESLSLFAKNPK